jgi:RNA polymerase sigma factor (sigma-70 family)
MHKLKKRSAVRSIQTRKTLIEKIIENNDNDSWETFCDSYQDYIFTMIKNMGVEHQDSEELKQDVLVKAWKALPGFTYDPEKGKFRWWLFTIVKNTVYKYFRDNSRNVKGDNATELAENSNFIEPEVDKLAEEEWKRFVVNKAWVVVARCFDEHVIEIFSKLSKGAKVKDIAREYGIKENTVNAYKSRVRRSLYREIVKIEHELDC